MRLIPASLFGRLTLIFLVGLLAAQFAGLWLHLQERAALLLHGGAAGHELPGRFGLHLALTLGAVVAVSLVAVRLVTRPMKQLAEAAEAFGRDLDAPPLAETGPLESRRAAEAFNGMQSRLKRLIAERARALAAVSHDLRTPLTRLRLRAELVEDETLRGQIGADLDEMQAMVEATLGYLRGLQDNEPIQAIDIGALLASLAADAQALGRPVSLAALPALPPYRGRLSLLRRALDNLIDNAVKYGRSAAISVTEAAGSLDITVVDQGPGIPAADLTRVVEPYVRLDGSRSRATGGVGLGLAIASDCARAHGGALKLSNRPEGGLAATLALPRRATY